MTPFQEQIAADNAAIFMNENEFAEKHNLNGKTCSCIVQNITSDDDLTTGNMEARKLYDIYGVHKEVNVVNDSLDKIPVYGQTFYLDDELYTVMDVADDMGVLTIVLVANNR